MKFWQNQKKNALGIDISDSSIKILGVSRNQRTVCADAFAQVKLPSAAVVEKNIKDIVAVADALEKALMLARTDKREAAVALADASIMTHTISARKDLSEVELETQIWSAVEQTLPYPLEEICLDYLVKEENIDSTNMSVLIAAASKKTVSGYLEVLFKAGLTPVAVDVESWVLRYACQFCFPEFIQDIKQIKQSAFAIVDFGAVRTNTFIYYQTFPVFTSTENFGCEFLARDISTTKFDFTEKADKADIVLYKEFKKNAIKHLKKSLVDYAAKPNAVPVSKLILAGGVTGFIDFAELVEKELDLPVAVAHPVLQLEIGKKVSPQQLMQHSRSLLTALGLALREKDT